MMLSEFDSLRLGNDIRKIVDSQPRGFANQIIKLTGISHASLYRLMDGDAPVKNVNLLLSVCAFLGLDFAAYIIGRAPDPTSKRKSGSLIEVELIRTQYVERHFAKGYMDRDFYVSSRRYQWCGNIPTPLGIIRVGILVND